MPPERAQELGRQRLRAMLLAMCVHNAIEDLHAGEGFITELHRSALVQLARHAGIRVIGTAGPEAQERLRELGAIPVDYRSEDVPARVRELAPEGVAAVFYHVGGPGIVDSWRMLAPGGTLVSYGTAATRDVPGNPRLPVLKLFARLMLWNALPNWRRATFFNLWAGAGKRDC
jgi:NADPH2:quinone reductase